MSMTTDLQSLKVATDLVSVVVQTVITFPNSPGTVLTNLSPGYQDTVQTVFDQSTSALIVETTLSTGIRGEPGMTPYEEWLADGNTGSYNDFLISIANLSTGAVWAETQW